MQQMASSRSRNRQTDPKERWSADLQEAEYFGGSLVSYTTVDCMPDKGGRSQGDEGNPHPQPEPTSTTPRLPGGGMMMLAGCAGLGEHGRRKRQIEMSIAAGPKKIPIIIIILSRYWLTQEERNELGHRLVKAGSCYGVAVGCGQRVTCVGEPKSKW
jgi:hypothetical protein